MPKREPIPHGLSPYAATSHGTAVAASPTFTFTVPSSFVFSDRLFSIHPESWWAGHAAGHDNLPLSSNPYDLGTDDHAAWTRGHCSGSADRLEGEGKYGLSEEARDELRRTTAQPVDPVADILGLDPEPLHPVPHNGYVGHLDRPDPTDILNDPPLVFPGEEPPVKLHPLTYSIPSTWTSNLWTSLTQSMQGLGVRAWSASWGFSAPIRQRWTPQVVSHDDIGKLGAADPRLFRDPADAQPVIDDTLALVPKVSVRADRLLDTPFSVPNVRADDLPPLRHTDPPCPTHGPTRGGTCHRCSWRTR